jgi:hypothetical protein
MLVPPNSVSDDDVTDPCPHVSPQRRPPRLQAMLMKLTFHVFHPVLLWFRVIVMTRFLSCAQDFLFFPSLPFP